MPAARPRPQRGPWRRGFIIALKVGIVAALAALTALAIAVYVARSSLPSFEELKSSPNGQMIRVFADDGTLLVSLGPSYGEWIGYGQIPLVMRDAMVSVEDRRFRSHLGVDPIGVARSFKVRWDTGRWTQGGSTITQQLARNIFLSNTRTFGRKAREMVLALAMERKYSKDQILELYLNKVYFGGGAYGIDAASRKFFGHSGAELSLIEAAVIAGLVKAPSNYSPTADAEAAIGRAGVVIGVMREAGKITAAQAAAADPASVELVTDPRQNSVRYFTDWAIPQLEVLIDEASEPLNVYTTLDLDMQRAADRAIRANAPAGAQGALVALDRGGQVRAMVGGKDYVSSIYNRATQAVRQPGSSFKLFVYLAALEAGVLPDDQAVDEAVTIDGWSPRNNSGRFSGEIDVRTAFAYSINTVAAKLGLQVGFGTVADMARRFGITTPVNTRPSMVLGTSDVRLIDMTRAFASVAAKGVAVTPFGIKRVTTTGDRLLFAHQVDSSRVLVAPYVAAQMTDLLQTAVATGTGAAAQIGRPVAGKTGTTSSNKDGWFLGFSSGITTGVWMGRDDARAVGGLQGGRAPARAFHDFMEVAVRGRPVEAFDTAVTLPEWQLEPDQEAYFGDPDNAAEGFGEAGGFVDADGNPVTSEPGFSGPAEEGDPQPRDRDRDVDAPEQMDEDWIDRVLDRPGRRPVEEAPPEVRRPPPRRDQEPEPTP